MFSKTVNLVRIAVANLFSSSVDRQTRVRATNAFAGKDATGCVARLVSQATACDGGARPRPEAVRRSLAAALRWSEIAPR